jgi:type IV fimbrial biogenesis protein FimT
MNHRGFTLIELLVVIAVLGLSLAAAYPSFRTAIQNNRVTTQANELLTGINLARSEALRASRFVSVCPSADGAACDAGAPWGGPFLVFYDDDRDGVLDAAPEALIRTFNQTAGGITVTRAPAAPVHVTYAGSGALEGTALITMRMAIPECKGNQVREMNINLSGRASMRRVDCP